MDWTYCKDCIHNFYLSPSNMLDFDIASTPCSTCCIYETSLSKLPSNFVPRSDKELKKVSNQLYTDSKVDAVNSPKELCKIFKRECLDDKSVSDQLNEYLAKHLEYSVKLVQYNSFEGKCTEHLFVIFNVEQKGDNSNGDAVLRNS